MNLHEWEQLPDREQQEILNRKEIESKYVESIKYLKLKIKNLKRNDILSDQEKYTRLLGYWEGICDVMGIHLPAEQYEGIEIISEWRKNNL